jgi:hypothetical protein
MGCARSSPRNDGKWLETLKPSRYGTDRNLSEQKVTAA